MAPPSARWCGFLRARSTVLCMCIEERGLYKSGRKKGATARLLSCSVSSSFDELLLFSSTARLAVNYSRGHFVFVRLSLSLSLYERSLSRWFAYYTLFFIVAGWNFTFLLLRTRKYDRFPIAVMMRTERVEKAMVIGFIYKNSLS